MPRRVYITQIQQAHTTALPLGNTSGTFDPSVRSSVVSFFRSCRAFRHPSNKTAAINVTVKLCCVADPFNRSCPLITGAPLFYRAKLLWRGVDQRRDKWRTSNLISWLEEPGRALEMLPRQIVYLSRRQSAAAVFRPPQTLCRAKRRMQPRHIQWEETRKK